MDRTKKKEWFSVEGPGNDQETDPSFISNLLEYFEEANKSQNNQANSTRPYDSEFVSAIQFAGTPILPPVLTARKREEIQGIRRQMLKVESRKRSKRRPELVARAQSIVDQIDSDGSCVSSEVHGIDDGQPSQSHIQATSGRHYQSSQNEMQEEGLYTDDQFVLKNQDSLPANDRFSLEPSNAMLSENVLTNEADYGQLLDSLGSDFVSLDDTSLPTDFNGLPLTSIKQQQISHVLAKLSRVLNIHDTNSLLSTGGSTISSGEDADTLTAKSSVANQHGDTEGYHCHTGSKDGGDDCVTSWNMASSVTDSQDTVVEIHTASKASNSPASDSQFVSPSQNWTSTNSSIISNESQRSSRSLKNTVHFSKLVTEINTRQSVEDNITFRQLKVTPTNSPRILGEAVTDGTNAKMISKENINKESLPKNAYDSGSSSTRPRVQQLHSNKPMLGESLLSRVSLTPDTVSPCLSPVDKSLSFPVSHDDMSTDREEVSMLNPSNRVTSPSYVPSSLCNEEDVPTKFDVVSDCDNEQMNELNVKRENSPGQSAVSVNSSTRTTNITGETTQDTLTNFMNTLTNKETLGRILTLEKSTDPSNDVIRDCVSRVLTSLNSVDTVDDDTLRQYRAALAETLESQSTLSAVNQSPITDCENTSRTVDSTRSGMVASLGQLNPARRGSYSLDEPSPVLLRSHAKTIESGILPDSTTDSVYPQEYNKITIDGSIKRTLDYEDDDTDCDYIDHQKQDRLGNENLLEPDMPDTEMYLREVQKLVGISATNDDDDDDDDMQYSKENQLHRYLQDQCVLHIQSPPTDDTTHQLSLEDSLKATQEFLLSAQMDPALSIEEMMHLQAQKFEEIKEKIIEQQKMELEELFVRQRREQLLLQDEIEKQQVSIKHTSSNTSESPQNLLNHSFLTTDSPSTHRHHGPVQHSPAKKSNVHRRNTRVVVPERAFDPSVRRLFDRVSAAAKGYLLRRLIKTERVQELIKTIADTRDFALNFQMETPIKKGKFTSSDSDLLDRIIAQLQAALLEVHDIFFIIPVSERMSLIQQSRELAMKKRLKDQATLSKSMTHGGLSSATLKAMERKRKAALETSSGLETLRPKSAPPATSSPRSYRLNMDLRALKPLQGHISPIRPDNDKIRSHKRDRLNVIPERKQENLQNVKNKKPAVSEKTAENKKVISKGNPVVKAKPKVNVGKAWR